MRISDGSSDVCSSDLLAEAAGFKLAGKSEVNANPADTADHPQGVWTLPPTLKLGEQDRAKYLAIGESDRMTLKFVKPASSENLCGQLVELFLKLGELILQFGKLFAGKGGGTSGKR